MHLNPIHQALRSTLLRQAEEAFSQKPDLAGVIHGRRRVHPGARGKRPAYFPSRINNATMVPESQPENWYCLLLERDPSVAGYRCQVPEIEYVPGSWYFADFLVRTTDNRWLVREVKPSRTDLPDDDRERFSLVESMLRECDFDFAVVDTTDFPSEPCLQNLHTLYLGSAFRPWSRLECELAMKQIAQLPLPQPLSVLYSQLEKAGLSPLLMDYLLFHGQLIADLNPPLQLDLLARLPS
jgi:hypothetical protein